MVAYDSRRTPDAQRALPPEAIAELKAAIEAELSVAEPPTDRLRDVVHRAAGIARERGARPEDLVAVLRLIEREIAGDHPALPASTRESLGSRIALAMLRAYFDP